MAPWSEPLTQPSYPASIWRLLSFFGVSEVTQVNTAGFWLMMPGSARSAVDND
jgi:hypothetical protein